MSIRGIDFFNVAEAIQAQLHPTNPNEAEIRTLISRAYYGVFIQARDKASLTNTSLSIHQDVRAYYRQHFGKVGVRISNRLKDLMILRQQADYDSAKNLLKRDADKALKLGTSILEDLK